MTEERSPEQMRLAFAEMLANELGVDMTPKFLDFVDMILMKLWLKDIHLTYLISEDLDE